METAYRVTDATTWRELDGEVVALDTAASVYYSIGGFGSRLWHRLVTGASRPDLVAEITATFEDVAESQAEADVEEFLATCLENGLIEATKE